MTESGVPRRRVGCGVAAVVVVVALLAYGYHVVTSAVATEPDEVARIVAEMAWGADVPDGYEGEFGVRVPGARIALLVERGGAQLLYVASSTRAGGRDKLEERVRTSIDQRSGGRENRVEVLEPGSAAVGGEVIELQRFRLTSEGEPALLRVDAALPERGEHAVIVTAYGPEEGFDDGALRAFLASIELPPPE